MHRYRHFQIVIYLKIHCFYTYWHFGRKPASMVAPDIPRHLLLKSTLVMMVSMVTGLLDASLPLKVNFKSAKLYNGERRKG
jgi:hypothetical protein